MLTFHCSAAPVARARGFSLIEMMVSIVIGIIVAAGAMSLIFAINQSNTETISSTRLTQELRTLASVMSQDIKRTRRIDDPIAMVGQGVTTACPTATAPVAPAQPCYPVRTSGTTGCLAYGYTGTIANQALYNYRYVWLNGTGIQLDQYTFDPSAAAKGDALPTPTALTAACPIAATPAATTKTTLTLSPSEVKITSLCFSSSTDAGTCFFDSTTNTCKLNAIVPVGNEIDVCVAGTLQAGDTYSKTITRGYVQAIFVRSVSPSGS